MEDFDPKLLTQWLLSDDDAPLTGEQIAAFEAALVMADETGTDDLAMRLRLALLRRGSDAFAGEKAIDAYRWCLDRLRRDPTEYESVRDEIVLFFPVIIHDMLESPTVALDEIDRLINEMEGELLRHPHLKNWVHESRWRVAIAVGDHETAKAYFPRWSRAARGDDADFLRVEYYSDLDQHRKVLEYGRRVLDSNHVDREEMLTAMLRSLALTDQVAIARTYHNKRIAWLRRTRKQFSEVPCHIAFLAHVGEFSKGIKLIERFLPMYLATENPVERHSFATATAHLFCRIAASRPTCTVRLPVEAEVALLPGRRPNARRPGDLAAFFERAAAAIGRQFNSRNGNASFTARAQRELCY